MAKNDEIAAKARSANNEDPHKFPTFADAMRRAAQDQRYGGDRIRRVDIRFGADGNAVYRVWFPGEEDYGAGAISAPE